MAFDIKNVDPEWEDLFLSNDDYFRKGYNSENERYTEIVMTSLIKHGYKPAIFWRACRYLDDTAQYYGYEKYEYRNVNDQINRNYIYAIKELERLADSGYVRADLEIARAMVRRQGIEYDYDILMALYTLYIKDYDKVDPVLLEIDEKTAEELVSDAYMEVAEIHFAMFKHCKGLNQQQTELMVNHIEGLYSMAESHNSNSMLPLLGRHRLKKFLNGEQTAF
ncbi:MAG: hypothetical protein IJ446_06775 [Oscillospiraceae bacterium]|nr:hypothetical protein [Oscillospiraceae bacterium]